MPCKGCEDRRRLIAEVPGRVRAMDGRGLVRVAGTVMGSLISDGRAVIVRPPLKLNKPPDGSGSKK